MGYRYIGSKDKLSGEIITTIKKFAPCANKIIDLMAGTGLFSLALRENDFKVTAVDVMTYSYHHLNVHLFMQKAPCFDGISAIEGIEKYRSKTLFGSDNYATILNYLDTLEPVLGYFFKEYSPGGNPENSTRPRKYFTSENAARIDAIRSEIKRLLAKGIINTFEHSLLMHDLIMAVNDIANIAGTYGHYLSKFVARAKTPLRLQQHRFSSKGTTEGHNVIQGYAEKIACTLEADLCYIDPPYMKRQYAANYHILETLAREDEPEAIGESGLRPWRDQYSNFCTKTKIQKSWDTILSSIKVNKFVISYSEDGLIDITDLVTMFQKYGRVEKRNICYKRFKSNNSTKTSTLTEYLLTIHRT